DDGHGGTATQAYVVNVEPQPGDLSPMILSQPDITVRSGQHYTYSVRAFDPDGDPLRYLLTNAPTGMTIDSGTGLVDWNAPVFDDAVELSGSNYVVTPNLKSFFPTNSVTLELWFNATGPGVLVDEQGSTPVNSGFHDSQIEILGTHLMARMASTFLF